MHSIYLLCTPFEMIKPRFCKTHMFVLSLKGRILGLLLKLPLNRDMKCWKWLGKKRGRKCLHSIQKREKDVLMFYWSCRSGTMNLLVLFSCIITGEFGTPTSPVLNTLTSSLYSPWFTHFTICYFMTACWFFLCDFCKVFIINIMILWNILCQLL